MDRLQYLEILEKAMIPSAWSIRGLKYIFMHNNASCHKVHPVTSWMDENDVNCTTYMVGTISELNTIEHVWDYFARILKNCQQQFFLNIGTN